MNDHQKEALLERVTEMKRQAEVFKKQSDAGMIEDMQLICTLAKAHNMGLIDLNDMRCGGVVHHRYAGRFADSFQDVSQGVCNIVLPYIHSAPRAANHLYNRARGVLNLIDGTTPVEAENKLVSKGVYSNVLARA
ncbi:MAG: hypothetical protein CMH32_05495 [Micavibrio sp.]|nr:hypothetical protein [Micavibrio sp.]HCK32037.1 hypothetical protein [Rhodospirillaceae bacterium]|tara:strand:- start:736 stop:1140 length:405 start_codon:yes stop_codon:yes gene_type:complete